MKPCDETEIVGINSMAPNKDYLRGYEAAEKNAKVVLKKICAEIEDRKSHFKDATIRAMMNEVLEIIDKYTKGKSE